MGRKKQAKKNVKEVKEKVKEAKDEIMDSFMENYYKCGHCGSVEPKWNCARCHGVKYCNRQCQSSDWKIKHRNQCHYIFMNTSYKHYADKEESNFSKVCEVTDSIFSNNSAYPLLETDPNMHVMVTDLVSFGDFGDARTITTEKIPVTGTIIGTMNTVRHFHPGVYRCTRAIPFKNWEPVYIYHHENIDPAKIMRQSFCMIRDFNVFYKDIINYINRYDWTHWSYLGGRGSEDEDDDEDDDEDEDEDEDYDNEDEDDKRQTSRELFKEGQLDMMYFTKAEKASCLKKSLTNGHIVYSNIIPSHYIVTSPQSNSPIAMAVKVESSEAWKLGKAFQDISSQRYFALMIYSYFGMQELDDYACPIRDLNSKLSRRYPDIQFSSVKGTELKFNMTDFSV